MARIQITGLNPSDSELMDELIPEQLLAINGGLDWDSVFRAVRDFFDNIP
jgi:hypothetical protein